jgi:hypothetical protein
MSMKLSAMIVAAALALIASVGHAEDRSININLNTIPSDLTVPLVVRGEPAAGRRVWQCNPGYEGWKVQHAIYLPRDWRVGESRKQIKYPVLVEFPGNGDYQNALGDKSLGGVEDCKLGYGIGGGERFIWVSLPFVDRTTKAHTTQWWGDADLTAAYCRTTVARVCDEYGGDAERVILCGFSRGAIACGYIGLRDEQTAKLWRAMVIHSHYDGVRRWNYPQQDEASARQRLARFAGKRQFISQENSIDDIERFLSATAAGETTVRATLLRLPYPNHSDEWVLKAIAERAVLRRWVDEVLR